MYNLVDENKYQVFLCQCPGIIPFNFVTHHWFVVNQKGDVSRWEVSYKKRDRELRWGYLNKDLYPPFEGIRMFGISAKPAWKSRVIASIEGDEGSLAQKMAVFIDKTCEIYPYCGEYSIFGVTSNTFVQWVLNQFPEADIKLPWNAFGKDMANRI